jgi:hypothetical protein
MIFYFKYGQGVILTNYYSLKNTEDGYLSTRDQYPMRQEWRNESEESPAVDQHPGAFVANIDQTEFIGEKPVD